MCIDEFFISWLQLYILNVLLTLLLLLLLLLLFFYLKTELIFLFFLTKVICREFCLCCLLMSSGQLSDISSYCLDEKSFHLCCKSFLQHSGVIRDGWSWADVKGSDEGYMKKTAIIRGKLGSLLNHKADDGMNAVTGVDECDDEAVGNFTVQSQVLVHYEYHILYSIAHQAPVLYFRASTLDGQPLSLDEVWSNIHPNYRQRVLQGPWDTLTQQEHPFLGQPFFMLHPCHTEEFMKPLFKMADQKKRKINYIPTWLSVVGPVVGLDVPLKYHTNIT